MPVSKHAMLSHRHALKHIQIRRPGAGMQSNDEQSGRVESGLTLFEESRYSIDDSSAGSLDSGVDSERDAGRSE